MLKRRPMRSEGWSSAPTNQLFPQSESESNVDVNFVGYMFIEVRLMHVDQENLLS